MSRLALHIFMDAFRAVIKMEPMELVIADIFQPFI